jgi:N-acetylmuramoyl-L-alanine amidase
MSPPSDRDKETRELIERFQVRRRRRRRLNALLAGLAGAAVLIAVVAVVVWAVGSLNDSDSGNVAVALPTADDSSATGSDALATVSGNTASSTTTTDGTEPGGISETTVKTASPRLIDPARTATTARPTTTAAPPTTAPPTTSPSQPASAAGSSQKIVVIDPGHQAKGDSSLEPIGPGSSQMKAKVSSGTAGVVTGIPESELNLVVGLKLRDTLEASGVKVIMTRTTQDVRISNIERVQIANAADADLFVRVHADGSANSSTHGIHVLYPASIEGWTDDIAAASKRAAQLMQQELIAATGAKDRGIDARSDMTGFNWSDVPAVIPEIGFMTNPDEDRLLATDSYRDKVVEGLARAILSFLDVS